MPQKGQTAKHEWAGKLWKACHKCGVKKFSYGAGVKPQYELTDGTVTYLEPPCITRTLKTEDHEKTT